MRISSPRVMGTAALLLVLLAISRSAQTSLRRTR